MSWRTDDPGCSELKAHQMRRRADRTYFAGRVGKAIDLYGEILERYGVDLATLAALAEIARLFARTREADTLFSAARVPIDRRLRQILAGGGSPARPGNPTGSVARASSGGTSSH